MSAHKPYLTRIALLGAAAALMITCSDSPVSAPSDLEGPLFAIADGGHGGGNVDVFFMEPLTDFDATNPNFGDRPPNPYLAPVARVCALNATEADPDPYPEELGCIPFGEPGYDQDTTSLVMVYDPAGSFYKANLKDVSFDLLPERMYRIEIFLGNRSLHAYRDVDPDEGPPVASCTDEPFCQFNSQGSGSVPIKVIIEAGAACYDPLDPDADLDACATATLSAGESLFLQDDGVTIGAATVDDVDGSATISIQYCADFRDRLYRTDGRVDLPTFGDCLKLENLDNPLEVYGTVTECHAYNLAIEAGLSETAAGRMTVHRFSTDPAAGHPDTVVALPHAQFESACFTNGLVPRGPDFEFGPVQQLVRFARRSWRTVSGWVLAMIQPPPAWACHHGGCASEDGFRSDYQAAQPAWMEYHADNPDGDLGTHDVNTTVTGKVQAWDSGQLEDSDSVAMEPVNNVRLTATVTSAYGEVSSSEIFTGSDGIATFDLTVGPGLNTVEVKGIGVGTGGIVFAPTMDDPDAPPVPLEDRTLTFTAYGRVPLWFVPDPFEDPVFYIGATGSATIADFSVCAGYEGIEIETIDFIKNNGDPVEAYIPLAHPWTTDASGCVDFSGVTIDKTGAYRILANGEFTSQKFNVKPPLKK